MFALRSSLVIQQQLRLFSKSVLKGDRFSRDSLRGRLQKQNLKDVVKQQAVESHGPPPYAKDMIPVRPARDLRRALGFTLAVGSGSFTIAVISDLDRLKKQARNLFQSTSDIFKTSFENFNKTRSDELKWKDLSLGDRTALILVGMNALVFALWKVKSLQPFMWRYFTNSYASKSLCLPMLLSAFSHSSLIHLGLNMYVVYSFTNVAIDKFLGPDQFWAFYVTAAVFSSLTSLAHKSAIRSPVRALGASGAILGLLAYTCMKIPEAQLSIVFIPQLHFSAESAIIGIVLFDLAGLIFRFRLFDHAAHLGGSLFGVFYALYGEHLIWDHYGGFIEKIYKRWTKDQ